MALSRGKKKPADTTEGAPVAEVEAAAVEPKAKKGKKGKSASLVPDTLPIVNLIGGDVAEKYAQARLIRNFAFGAVGVVVASAAIWGLQAAQIGAANSALEEAQAETATIQGEITRLSPVKNLSMEIAKQETLATTFSAREVNASGTFEELNVNTPTGVDLASANVQVVDFSSNPAIAQAGAALSPCGESPNPFSSPTLIGCLRFDGTAPSRSVLGDMLTQLSASSGFYGPYVAGTSVIENGVSFTGSVALTVDAFADPLAGAQSLQAQADAAASAAAAQAAAEKAAAEEAAADPTAE